MLAVTIVMDNKNTIENVLWFLNHLKNDGVKIISQKEITKEDFKDLKNISKKEEFPFEILLSHKIELKRRFKKYNLKNENLLSLNELQRKMELRK